MTIHDERDAIATLLNQCPELQGAWDSLCVLFSTTDARDIGIYTIIGSIALPALAALIGGADGSIFSLIRRIYVVLDEWAAAECSPIVDAMNLEFISEGGYGSNPDDPSVTAEQILAPSGPKLRALARRPKR